ncbi:MAG: nodulation protein NfeD [Thaumarchaeota archaeon]|nr:nodulation protein NfeD [Nitrososphaerota archaeon]
MRYLRLLLAAALLLAFAAQLAPVHAQSCGPKQGTYYVASLNANIDPGAADFMSSTVSNAESLCAANIVFVLTTNGGDGASMESMIGSIQSYQQWGGNFTTLVAPEGAFAFSAGSYIAESSDKIVMEPGTTIGSATPIVSGIPTGEENSTLTKDTNAFASYMQTLTHAHGRNATATALMVTKGVSYCSTPASATIPCPSASKEHVVDVVISSTTLQGALTYLGVPADTPVNTPGVRSELISVLSDPNVSSLMFLLGVFAVLADIYHPTIILSVVGVVVIAAALFGLGVFGASPLAIILMIVGSAFIFLEVKTQHGISALLGVVVFIFGFLLIYQFPPASGASPTPSNPIPPQAATFSGIPDITYGLIVALGAAIVIGSLYLRSIREALKKRPRVNEPSALIGREGTMESDAMPGGKGVAEVASEEWSVTSTQALKRGDAVRVKGVSGNTLTVEKVER